MNIHLPIAVCLMRQALGDGLEIAVHQVTPEDPRSLGDFVERQGKSGATLLHHVVFFTHLSYAECQHAVRRFVGCRDSRRKAVEGARDAVAAKLTRVALDSSVLLDYLGDGRRQSSPPLTEAQRRGGVNDALVSDDDSDDDSVGSLDDFVVEDGEEEEEEEEDLKHLNDWSSDEEDKLYSSRS